MFMASALHVDEKVGVLDRSFGGRRQAFLQEGVGR